jgi:hypothetical protein
MRRCGAVLTEYCQAAGRLSIPRLTRDELTYDTWTRGLDKNEVIVALGLGVTARTALREAVNGLVVAAAGQPSVPIDRVADGHL